MAVRELPRRQSGNILRPLETGARGAQTSGQASEREKERARRLSRGGRTEKLTTARMMTTTMSDNTKRWRLLQICISSSSSPAGNKWWWWWPPPPPQQRQPRGQRAQSSKWPPRTPLASRSPPRIQPVGHRPPSVAPISQWKWLQIKCFCCCFADLLICNSTLAFSGRLRLCLLAAR